MHDLGCIVMLSLRYNFISALKRRIYLAIPSYSYLTLIIIRQWAGRCALARLRCVTRAVSAGIGRDIRGYRARNWSFDNSGTTGPKCITKRLVVSARPYGSGIGCSFAFMLRVRVITICLGWRCVPLTAIGHSREPWWAIKNRKRYLHLKRRR